MLESLLRWNPTLFPDEMAMKMFLHIGAVAIYTEREIRNSLELHNYSFDWMILQATSTFLSDTSSSATNRTQYYVMLNVVMVVHLLLRVHASSGGRQRDSVAVAIGIERMLPANTYDIVDDVL